MERKSKKEAIITIIVMLIIAAVIVSWLTGLWNFNMGRKDLTEEERLTISDYINSVSVLVQRSNKISIDFFIALDNIKEITREELDSRLSEIIEESKVIVENCEELTPPDYFEVTHGYLKLVFKLRSRAYENFKPALFNVTQDLDLDISSSQITNTFIDMYMSDEIYRYFQEELMKSGEKLEIEGLTIIDSEILEDKNLTNNQNVVEMISEIKTVTDLQERRGVAVISQSIDFDPQVKNEQENYWILANGSDISVTINIENQGNVVENDVGVTMTYKVENNPQPEEKSYTITTINPSKKRAVTISGFTAYPGSKCELTINAGPVPNEVYEANNTFTIKFIMEK